MGYWQALFGAVTDGHGSTRLTDASNEFITRGKIELTSTDGSIIQLEDGDSGTHTGLTKLGLSEQRKFASSSSTGLSVTSVEGANSALTAIDAAIEQVSSFRASFGAYENRLDCNQQPDDIQNQSRSL